MGKRFGARLLAHLHIFSPSSRLGLSSGFHRCSLIISTLIPSYPEYFFFPLLLTTLGVAHPRSGGEIFTIQGQSSSDPFVHSVPVKQTLVGIVAPVAKNGFKWTCPATGRCFIPKCLFDICDLLIIMLKNNLHLQNPICGGSPGSIWLPLLSESVSLCVRLPLLCIHYGSTLP